MVYSRGLQIIHTFCRETFWAGGEQKHRATRAKKRLGIVTVVTYLWRVIIIGIRRSTASDFYDDSSLRPSPLDIHIYTYIL